MKWTVCCVVQATGSFRELVTCQPQLGLDFIRETALRLGCPSLPGTDSPDTCSESEATDSSSQAQSSSPSPDSLTPPQNPAPLGMWGRPAGAAAAGVIDLGQRDDNDDAGSNDHHEEDRGDREARLGILGEPRESLNHHQQQQQHQERERGVPLQGPATPPSRSRSGLGPVAADAVQSPPALNASQLAVLIPRDLPDVGPSSASGRDGVPRIA